MVDFKVQPNRIHAIGRRKTSSASVFLQKGKGRIYINRINAKEYWNEENSGMRR